MRRGRKARKCSTVSSYFESLISIQFIQSVIKAVKSYKIRCLRLNEIGLGFWSFMLEIGSFSDCFISRFTSLLCNVVILARFYDFNPLFDCFA